MIINELSRWLAKCPFEKFMGHLKAANEKNKIKLAFLVYCHLKRAIRERRSMELMIKENSSY